MENNTDDLPGVVAHPPLIYLLFMAIGALLQNQIPINLTIPGQRVLGVLLATGGFSLSSWSVIHFFQHRVNPDPFKPTTGIITTGPYRYSRNPIYIAFVMIQMGMGVWAQWPWMLITAVPATAIIFFGVILPEERYLEKKFGEDYMNYRSRVRRWI
jgi:protein-S-isoprenylcysteine O-methyltransferase Ste14